MEQGRKGKTLFSSQFTRENPFQISGICSASGNLAPLRRSAFLLARKCRCLKGFFTGSIEVIRKKAAKEGCSTFIRKGIKSLFILKEENLQ